VTWLTRYVVNGVRLLNLTYLIILVAYLSSQGTPNVQIKYFMFDWYIYILFVLNKGRKPDSFQIIICVHNCSTWSIVELKTRFETWIKWNYVNSVCLFLLSYLITLRAYLCSQWTPNVHIKYFMFDLIIQTIWAQRGWKRDCLEIMNLVYICSTCS
jgi:hypothetical protein